MGKTLRRFETFLIISSFESFYFSPTEDFWEFNRYAPFAMKISDALATLGLESGATSRDARKAYLRLIKVHKPETDPEGFAKVREAYDTLKKRLPRNAVPEPGPLSGAGLETPVNTPPAFEGSRQENPVPNLSPMDLSPEVPTDPRDFSKREIDVSEPELGPSERALDGAELEFGSAKPMPVQFSREIELAWERVSDAQYPMGTRKELKQAIETHPEHFEFRSELFEIELETGRKNKAIDIAIEGLRNGHEEFVVDLIEFAPSEVTEEQVERAFEQDPLRVALAWIRSNDQRKRGIDVLENASRSLKTEFDCDRLVFTILNAMVHRSSRRLRDIGKVTVEFRKQIARPRAGDALLINTFAEELFALEVPLSEETCRVFAGAILNGGDAIIRTSLPKNVRKALKAQAPMLRQLVIERFEAPAPSPGSDASSGPSMHWGWILFIVVSCSFRAFRACDRHERNQSRQIDTQGLIELRRELEQYRQSQGVPEETYFRDPVGESPLDEPALDEPRNPREQALVDEMEATFERDRATQESLSNEADRGALDDLAEEFRDEEEQDQARQRAIERTSRQVLEILERNRVNVPGTVDRR